MAWNNPIDPPNLILTKKITNWDKSDESLFCTNTAENNVINVDNNEPVAGKFQVRGIPTFILFKEGEIKWRKSGVIEEKEFIETISSNI